MDEGGFDFRRPSERRETRAFEPPPWEAEAFEELRKKNARAEQQVAEEAAVPEGSSAAQPDEAEPAEPSSEAPVTAQVATNETIDEGLMLEMLSGLAAEEPKSSRGVQRVTLVAGGGLALLGLALTVWGLVSVPRVQQDGRMVTLVLIVMGLAYLAVGLGLVYRALKQRGVL